MKPHTWFAFGLAATYALLPSDVWAGGAQAFGEKGELIVSADRLLPLFSYTSASVTDTRNNVDLTTSRSGSGLSFLFGRDLSIPADSRAVPINVHAIPRVAFDVSIIDRLTLGAAIAFGFGLGGTNADPAPGGGERREDAPTATAIGIAPRVGYVIPLGDLVAFWPRAGLGFYSVKVTSERPVGATGIETVRATDTLWSLDLDPQFALVPFEHFFIHVGPMINIPIAGSRSIATTTGARTDETRVDASVFHLGVSAGLGGWFDIFR